MRLCKPLPVAACCALLLWLVTGAAGSFDPNSTRSCQRVDDGADLDRLMYHKGTARATANWVCRPDSNVEYVSSTLWTGARDVCVVDDYAYCAFVNGLVILDLSDPDHPRLVSRVYLQSEGWGIFVKDDYAYVAHGCAGLVIIDVSDPANPDSVGGYDTPGFANDVFVSDTLAFVADMEEGLQVISVSDPSDPYLVGTHASGSAQGVYVLDSLAFVADYWYTLRVLSVSDPSNPYQVAVWDTVGLGYDVVVEDSLAYVANGPAGVQVICVSDPSHPYCIGSHDGDFASSIHLQDTLAFVADMRLRVLSVAQPASPYLVGSADYSFGQAVGVFVKDSLAYVTYERAGLEVFSVSDPATLSALGSYGKDGQITDVVVSDTVAYVAASRQGLKMLSVSDPYEPYLLGEFITDDYVKQVVVSDTLAYILCGGWLRIVSVGDPKVPYQVGKYGYPAGVDGVCIVDGLAYVVDGECFQVLSVRDPSSPHAQGHCSLLGGRAVCVEDSLALVAGVSGLHVVSVYDPTAPYVISFDSGCNEAHSVAVCDSVVYVGGNPGLASYSISRPEKPRFLGSCSWVPNRAFDLQLLDTLLFAASFGQGLQVVSVSDPSDPRTIASYSAFGFSTGVFVQHDLVCLACYNCLMILLPELVTTDVHPVDDGTQLSPPGFRLFQNYPNPLNPFTRIEFVLPEPDKVKLEIFNILGQKVRILLDAHLDAGQQTLIWDGRDDLGREVSSGVYMYRLTVAQRRETKKMLLLR